MNEFWKWVDTNGYGYLRKLHKSDCIGKMMRYLKEHTKKRYCHIAYDLSILNPNDIYEDLESRIEKL